MLVVNLVVWTGWISLIHNITCCVTCSVLVMNGSYNCFTFFNRDNYAFVTFFEYSSAAEAIESTFNRSLVAHFFCYFQEGRPLSIAVVKYS